ncbi:MAG: hypothetical protein KGI78_02860 [Patescibacteria group bacterium]|nr:hypothetical protein [Patescibacteria group bacterium]MDE1944628.1 hypothetical protein [Patescibacteria group bacterium]MDE1945405.1 hypothetical protein [Patescibacteria group bacterium]MDE2057770.1 hypothetical protein [Patescibacteria group bacterium]
MSFHKYEAALVQFRIPGTAAPPDGVIDLGMESYEASADRRETHSREEPLTTLLSRDGASLVGVPTRLANAGLVLERAYAERRHTGSTEHRASKIYTLITFIFRKGGTPPEDDALLGSLELLARERQNYVKVSEGFNRERVATVHIMGKTPASNAVELKDIEDAEAEAYGILVTRAVRKEDRGAESEKKRARNAVRHAEPLPEAETSVLVPNAPHEPSSPVLDIPPTLDEPRQRAGQVTVAQQATEPKEDWRKHMTKGWSEPPNSFAKLAAFGQRD